MRTSDKDIWDKFELLSKPIGALVGVVAVALIGYFGGVVVKEMESAESGRQRLAEQLRFRSEQDARRDEQRRLFAQGLIAETVDAFVGSAGDIDDVATEKQLRRLELIGRSYSADQASTIVPLLRELERDIQILKNRGNSTEREHDWIIINLMRLVRVRKLQNLILTKEMGRLSSDSVILQIRVPIKGMIKKKEFVWPSDEAQNLIDKAAQEVQDEESVPRIVREMEREMATATLQDVQREFTLRFSDYKEHKGQLKVNLSVVTVSASNNLLPSARYDTMTISRSFLLDRYSVPTADFKSLSHNQAVSVILNHVSENYVSIDLVLFPMRNIIDPTAVFFESLLGNQLRH